MLLSCETVSFKDYITQDSPQYCAVTQCVATNACQKYVSGITALQRHTSNLLYKESNFQQKSCVTSQVWIFAQKQLISRD